MVLRTRLRAHPGGYPKRRKETLVASDRGPWQKEKDRRGHSLLTYRGVLYRVEGTGHSLATLISKIKAGGSDVMTVIGFDPATKMEEN